MDDKGLRGFPLAIGNTWEYSNDLRLNVVAFETVTFGAGEAGQALKIERRVEEYDNPWSTGGYSTFTSNLWFMPNVGLVKLGDGSTLVSYQVSSVPEPSAWLLCAMGLAVVGLRGRKSMASSRELATG